MRIAHLFSYAGGGGAEAYALGLAKGSISAGDEVMFILSTDGELTENLKREGIEYKKVSMESSFNPSAVLKSAFQLKKLIKDKKIDIVHTHMLREQSLVMIAKILGSRVKLVRTFHRLDQFNWKMKLLIPFYNLKTDKFIAISVYMKDYLLLNGIKDKIEIIQNGVSEVKIKERGSLMGNLGRISPEKGLYRFFEENKNIFREEKFILGGDGPDESRIKTLVKKENLKVEFMGRVTSRNKFFEKIGVLVLPSETEALPLVVLEAFSCSIPVVSFDLPALRDVVQAELRAEVGNYRQLAELAQKARKHREKFGQENRKKYLKEYTIEQMTSKTNRLYRELV